MNDCPHCQADHEFRELVGRMLWAMDCFYAAQYGHGSIRDTAESFHRLLAAVRVKVGVR